MALLNTYDRCHMDCFLWDIALSASILIASHKLIWMENCIMGPSPPPLSVYFEHNYCSTREVMSNCVYNSVYEILIGDFLLILVMKVSSRTPFYLWKNVSGINYSGTFFPENHSPISHFYSLFKLRRECYYFLFLFF